MCIRDRDYTVRIGSDSFETTGVIMAMTPGTVEDLEHIKDLKEAKDTWQDAGDELYDSLEQMAQSIEAVSYTHLDVYKRQGLSFSFLP